MKIDSVPTGRFFTQSNVIAIVDETLTEVNDEYVQLTSRYSSVLLTKMHDLLVQRINELI